METVKEYYHITLIKDEKCPENVPFIFRPQLINPVLNMLDELRLKPIDGFQQENAVVNLLPLVLSERRHKRLKVSTICAYLSLHGKGIKSFRIMQLPHDCFYFPELNLATISPQ